MSVVRDAEPNETPISIASMLGDETSRPSASEIKELKSLQKLAQEMCNAPKPERLQKIESLLLFIWIAYSKDKRRAAGLIF